MRPPDPPRSDDSGPEADDRHASTPGSRPERSTGDLAAASRNRLAETSNLQMRELFGVVPFRAPSSSGIPTSSTEIPNRYEIRETEEGPVLRCREAPGLAVRVDASVNLGEAEARKMGERVVFLDGAGQFAPVLDDSRHLYNLDHHQGCLRAFTLATCEQALVLVLKGLDLDKGEWKIFANQPDLDTVFAVWILLNHRRIRDLRPEARDRIVPLIRLEGAIDANGFEIAEYCGLPQARLRAERERLDRLHALEREAQKSGEWTSNLPAYTARMCFELDRLVFDQSDFQDYVSVEREYGHVEIGADRVAVVCRDDAGIYDVETRLKKVWGDRLGIIALEKGENHYTLRRTASLAGIDLRDAYERLNLLDPRVDGKPADEKWGGSDDIGGSPRPSGTGLTPREITKILRMTYRPIRPFQRAQHLATATLWVVLLAFLGGLGVFGIHQLRPEGAAVVPMERALSLAVSAAIAGIGALLLTRELSRGWTWLFGWRWPGRLGGWPLLPTLLAGAVGGGLWVPVDVPVEPREIALGLGVLFLASFCAEVVFRGLVHGLLILDSRVQTIGGDWFLSRPTAASAVLYTAVTLGLVGSGLVATPWTLGDPLADLGLQLGAALTVGVSLGMLRERCLNLWWGLLFHFLFGALVLALMAGPLQ